MARSATSSLINVLEYYLLVVLSSVLLFRQWPALREAITAARLRGLSTPGGVPREFGLGGAQFTDPFADPFGGAFPASIAMLGALALVVPVAWVYTIIKRGERYDPSVLQSVIIMPIAVAGIVIIVQHSIALAFSLAGIVAAVRFRTTLKDTKDAVYIFLAVGTAMAAGAGALGIAFVTSVIFNYLVLTMWQRKIGDIYADAVKGRTPKLRLGDVLAGVGKTPGAGSGNLTIGDPSMLAALTPDTLGEIAERKARIRDHIESAGKKTYDGLLIILAEANEQTLDAIDQVLKQHTSDFKLAEVAPTPDGNSSLEYLVGLPAGVTPTQLVSTLRARAQKYIVAAEYRNLRGKSRKSKENRPPHWTPPRG